MNCCNLEKSEVRGLVEGNSTLGEVVKWNSLNR